VTPPSTIAHYRITAKLGEGGMGAVYRATDTKLNRDVAIKVLPDVFAADLDRLARFTREAQVLASLNHPNVAAIYGVEDRALVLELVEGPTLADRIAQGPIPLDEAIPLARQIAEALEYAHEKCIIHRDLKPANIKVTPEGRVKVLDFGLAKAMSGERVATDPANSPTRTMGSTVAGVILGTAAYMAPEQAKGKAVDKRADIWAFGVVLCEMVTGKRLFDGEDLTETLAAVVMKQPDLTAAPPKLRRLLARCLEKDPKKRLRDLGDVWELIEEPPDAPVSAPRPPFARAPWAIAALFIASTAVFAYLWLRTPAPETLSAQFEIDPPGRMQFTNTLATTALSPDGRYRLFAAGEQQPSNPLWLRPLNSLAARPLQGTEGTSDPFWSPNSESVAFYQDGKLKRIDIVGGAPQVLADAANGAGYRIVEGGSWSGDEILFASGGSLFRVAASGGEARKVTEVDAARKESGHGNPQFLPGGKRFLYFIRSSDPNIQGIYAASLGNPKDRVRIVATDRKAFYVPPRGGHSGYLLWMREQTLLAQPFDAGSLSLAGDPAPVAEAVAVGVFPTRAAYWISDAGLLTYRTGAPVAKARLLWMSRDGKPLGEARKEDRYGSLHLSPDGKRVVMNLSDDGGNWDIWMFEFARQVMTRLTNDLAREGIWSPDGSQIAYYSVRGVQQIYRTVSGGGGQKEPLTTGPNAKTPCGWSPHGRWLLYVETNPKTGSDIMALPLDRERKPVVVLQTQFNESDAQFSPDGKWIAYASNSSGRSEIYVRAFPPGPGSPWPVSNEGGICPRWRADGRELFYLTPGRNAVLAAGVHATGPNFESDAPRELFQMGASPLGVRSPYDVTADGQRFLLWQRSAETPAPEPLTVVTDWEEMLKK
jgi:eukaryotic-like serine/threonine-protein kinase